MLAFTLVELLVVIGIVVILIGVAAANWDSVKKVFTKPSAHGAFKAAPATIPPAPDTGAFLYEVRTGTGMAAAVKPGHGVRFELLDVDAGSGVIKTVTQDGNVAQIDAMTADGVSDANGDIKITVSLEEGRTARLKASDAASGASTPADDERTFTATQ
jgi:hypothetical protein